LLRAGNYASLPDKLTDTLVSDASVSELLASGTSR
jgi:hypothetical protein